MLSQRKSTKLIGINETLTLSKEKYMQALSHRFAHIFQSLHNLVHARSQGYFRLIMGLRVKAQSILIGDFTFSKHCCNHHHLLSSSFSSFSFENSNLDFSIKLFGTPLYFIHFYFSFSIKLMTTAHTFFYKEWFLLFIKFLDFGSDFFFLCPSLGSRSFVLYTHPNIGFWYRLYIQAS